MSSFTIQNFRVELERPAASGKPLEWLEKLTGTAGGAYDVMNLLKKVAKAMGKNATAAVFEGYTSAAAAPRAVGAFLGLKKTVEKGYKEGFTNARKLDVVHETLETGAMIAFTYGLFKTSQGVFKGAMTALTLSDTAEFGIHFNKMCQARALKNCEEAKSLSVEQRTSLNNLMHYSMIKMAKVAAAVFSGVSTCWALFMRTALVSKTTDIVAGFASSILNLGAAFQKDCYSTAFAKKIEQLPVAV